MFTCSILHNANVISTKKTQYAYVK